MYPLRIPLIDSVNTGEKEIRGMAEFIAGLKLKISDSVPRLRDAGPVKPVVNLLPYHNIATGKYQKLEIPYNEGEMGEPTEDEIERAVKIFEKYDLVAEIGG